MTFLKFIRAAAAALIGMIWAGTALAQAPLPTPANPAAINEDLRRRQDEATQPVRPANADPVVTVTAPNTAGAGDTAATARFRLNRVEFDPSAYLSAAELEALARDYVGRDVTYADLRALIAAINARYARLGVATANAVLPPQRIEGGVVHVRLVEGRIGATRYQGGNARAQAAVGRRVPLEPGSLADVNAIEQALLRFNRTGDTQLRATVVPGAQFGQTDVVLSLVEPKRFQLDLFADTNGYQSTGILQSGATVRAYRLLTPDDRLTASGLGAKGVRSASASYTVGVGPVRAGFSYAHGETDVVRGRFKAFGIAGTSDTLAMNAASLLLSTTRHSLLGSLSGQFTRARTDASAIRIGDSQVYAGDASLTYGYADTRSSLALSQAVSVTRSRELVQDLTRRATLFRGSLFGQTVIGTRWQLRGRADWQLTGNDDLNGVLQYQAGGTRSSRAFAPGSAGGDRGWSSGAELGYGIPAGRLTVQPYAFLEQATVSTRGVTARLGSAGGGVSIDVMRRASIDFYVAQRLTRPYAGLAQTRVAGAISARF